MSTKKKRVIGLVGGICSKNRDGKVKMRWKEHSFENTSGNWMLLY